MKNIRQTSYDIFVKKLREKMGKIFLREHLEKLWLGSGGSKIRYPYGLGKARNQGYIESLGGGIYRVTEPMMITAGQVSHIDDHYWYVVSLLIREHAPSGAIIAHEKSMQIYLRDYAIPDTLVLYTRDTAKRVRVGKYHFHFRTLKTGAKSGRKNMYRIFEKISKEIEIDNVKISILSLEASLLDVASLRMHDSGVAEDILIRFLKKYETSLSREILGELISYRYIRSINRLRSLTKVEGFDHLYQMSLELIKKEGGGCYLNL